MASGALAAFIDMSLPLTVFFDTRHAILVDKQVCHGLEDMPEGGEPREDFAPGVRILVFERRLAIAYRIVKDRVQVLRLFYAGRNTPSAFREN